MHPFATHCSIAVPVLAARAVWGALAWRPVGQRQRENEEGIMRYAICQTRVIGLVSVAAIAALSACSDATKPGPGEPNAGSPNVGAIQVLASTTGPDLDDDGYLVTVDTATTAAGRVAPNESTILSGLRRGPHAVWLRDVAEHCAVNEPNPSTVLVEVNKTVSVAFAVKCAGRSQLSITTETSGSPPDPDGYVVNVGGSSSSTSAYVPVAGTVNVAVAPGTHEVSLEGVATNCNVLSGRTHQIDVAAHDTVAVSFAIRCEASSVSELLFVRDGRIYGVNSDGTGLVRFSDGPNDADPSWSLDGRRIAFARNSGGRDEWGREFRDIYVMDADGSTAMQVTHTGYARQPAWSPDGRKIAFASYCTDGQGLQGCILVTGADADGSSLVRRGFDRGVHDSPAWSPDGSRIAFTSDYRAYDILFDLYVMNADGTGVGPLLQGPFFWKDGLTFYFQPAWSPDGRKIAVVVCPYAWDDCYPDSSIAIANADGSGLTTITAAGGFARPTWSPNGSHLAYSSTFCRTCPSSIYVVRADGSEKRLLIADGHSPAWRP
jgi:TolB protein